MAKKKSSGVNLKLILTALAGLLAVVGLCLFMFMDSLKFQVAVSDKTLIDEPLQGLKAIFGYTEEIKVLSKTYEGKILAFSFVNFLPLILVLAAIVLVVLGKKSKLFNGLAALLFVVAGIFLILAGNFVVVVEDFKKALDFISNFSTVKFVPSVGAYLGGVATILAGVAAGAKVVVK